MENVKKYMLERFLKYVTFDTESCDDATVVPTTEGQFVFARYLEHQLKEMGLEDVVLDEKGYLYSYGFVGGCLFRIYDCGIHHKKY